MSKKKDPRRQCKNCVFWKLYGGIAVRADSELVRKWGNCYRFPPVAGGIASGYHGDRLMDLWDNLMPMTPDDHWCGEFSDKRAARKRASADSTEA